MGLVRALAPARADVLYTDTGWRISMKAYRQSIVLDLVDREAITSQEQLRRRLQGSGVTITQATLSRDIKELGLVKRAADGAYSRPGPRGRSRTATSRCWKQRCPNLKRR